MDTADPGGLAAPDRTWLSRESREWGAACQTYETWSVEAIASAFGPFAAALPALQDACDAAARRYHAFSGPDAILNQIGEAWGPRVLAAALVSEPAPQVLAMQEMTGLGWYKGERLGQDVVRWTGRQFEVTFAWRHARPWKLELKVLRKIGSEQMTAARATVGDLACAVSSDVVGEGGVLTVVGPSPRPEGSEVRLQIELPWTYQPEGENRQLGLLVGQARLSAAPEAAGAPEPAAKPLEILTPVTRSADGAAFALRGAVSGRAFVQPGDEGELRFDIVTDDAALARGVELYVNGTRVPILLAAQGRRIWKALAPVAREALGRGGLYADWDLALPVEDALVWIRDLGLSTEDAGLPLLQGPLRGASVEGEAIVPFAVLLPKAAAGTAGPSPAVDEDGRLRLPLDSELFSFGWYGAEAARAGSFRWMSTAGAIRNPHPSLPLRAIEMRVTRVYAGGPPALRASLDGRELLVETDGTPAGPHRVRISPADAPKGMKGKALHLESFNAGSPAEEAGSDDRRLLSIAVADVTFTYGSVEPPAPRAGAPAIDNAGRGVPIGG